MSRARKMNIGKACPPLASLAPAPVFGQEDGQCLRPRFSCPSPWRVVNGGETEPARIKISSVVHLPVQKRRARHGTAISNFAGRENDGNTGDPRETKSWNLNRNSCPP